MVDIEKAVRMIPYQEYHGHLRDVQRCDGYILAVVGSVTLLLQNEMEDVLRDILGLQIAIIRTDIPHKEYIVRTIS